MSGHLEKFAEFFEYATKVGDRCGLDAAGSTTPEVGGGTDERVPRPPPTVPTEPGSSQIAGPWEWRDLAPGPNTAAGPEPGLGTEFSGTPNGARR